MAAPASSATAPVDRDPGHVPPGPGKAAARDDIYDKASPKPAATRAAGGDSYDEERPGRRGAAARSSARDPYDEMSPPRPAPPRPAPARPRKAQDDLYD
ncbi:MAG: hypothetical protein HY744_00170 [Deltaproteobacteria bacterium]|nr:hypothetical protein [Deltaproteobacteria bacterium]